MASTSNERTYAKIPKITKNTLLRHTILFGRRMKTVADELKVKYPTAKNIVYAYKNRAAIGKYSPIVVALPDLANYSSTEAAENRVNLPKVAMLL
jgi:hypothetical protein